jgi:hypothetical protein
LPDVPMPLSPSLGFRASFVSLLYIVGTLGIRCFVITSF